MSLDRRTFLGGAAGLAAATALTPPRAFAQDMPTYTPEDGAELRLLRWVPFVEAEGRTWEENSRAFTEKTGVPVTIEQESWEDVRPKAAVAANIGSGPDMVMSWFDDPFQYPDNLVDVTDLATALGARDGGWYPGLESYARRGENFIALPLATIGNAIVYRDSHVKQAGWSEFPTQKDDFLELMKAMQSQGTPAGFAHGKAVGDGNNYAHWLLWSHGGQMVDENSNVVIASPETKAAIEWAKQAYDTFIPGTESWQDINNNRAFLAGQTSLTANGVSLYYAAAQDPTMQEIAEDIRTTNFPIGPVGMPIELHQTTTLSIFNHTPYPEAAKAYLQHMYERENMSRWIEGASAYCCQPLREYADNPVWSSNPVHLPYARASETLRTNGYAGELGPASAGVMADYVLVDMFAEAVTGQRTPEEAMANAQRRAERYYR